MRKATEAVGGAVGLLALLVGVGWLGLQIKPAPFPPHPEKTRKLDTAKLRSDLPEPVAGNSRQRMGRRGRSGPGVGPEPRSGSPMAAKP